MSLSLDDALDAVRAYESGTADFHAFFQRLRPLRREDHEAELLPLLSDARWEARALAAQLLRYLPSAEGARAPIERERPRAAALAERGQVENDPRVLAALLGGLNELHHAADEPTCSALALRHATHADAAVRLASLGLLCSSVDPAALDALIAATRDPDDGVRDWASFYLGHAWGDGGLRFDGPAVRDALAQRLDDPFEDAREEAATGLLVRDDPRGLEAVERLVDAAATEGITECVLDAIAQAPRQRFVERLAALAEHQPDRPSLREALAACRSALRR